MRQRPLEPQQELFWGQVGEEADGSGLRSKWEVRKKGREPAQTGLGKFGCERRREGRTDFGSRDLVGFFPFWCWGLVQALNMPGKL